jgi:putative iron-dependent peroxidase
VGSPQSGIFALGTNSHTYLELDLKRGVDGRALVTSVAGLREPRTTMGGVNLVAGFRPELWSAVMPDDSPPGLHGFNQEIRGSDGFVMPATQHDAVLWINGSAYDVVFDMARRAIAALEPFAHIAEETSSWPYHHDRDLTGFIDGTENPTLVDAADVAVIPEPSPGAGGSVLLLQKWPHDAVAWESATQAVQEKVIGRRKPDSEELVDKAADSHVAKTDQDVFGKIFRRNMPFGTVTGHGTMFVGFSADQGRLHTMLESMAGMRDGVRDALTFFTKPMTGAYYFVPSIQGIKEYMEG